MTENALKLIFIMLILIPGFVVGFIHNKKFTREHPQYMSYLWGYFQAWSAIFSAIISLLIGILSLPYDGSGNSIFLVAISIPFFIAGFGVMWRRKWGWVLVCILSITTLIAFFIDVFYAKNRWREFSLEKESFGSEIASSKEKGVDTVSIQPSVSAISWILGVSAVALFGIAAVMLVKGRSTESAALDQVVASKQAEPMGEAHLTRIVVAAREVEAGTSLSENNLTLVQWPIDKVPRGAFIQIGDVVGRIALSKLTPGQPIIAAEFGNNNKAVTNLIRPGYRAVTIPSKAIFISPGNFVDVIAINNGRAETILEGIHVLAVNEESNRKKGVTLELTQRQSETLLGYSRSGEIDLALRNPEDLH